jgi:hypothetical protein
VYAGSGAALLTLLYPVQKSLGRVKAKEPDLRGSYSILDHLAKVTGSFANGEWMERVDAFVTGGLFSFLLLIV